MPAATTHGNRSQQPWALCAEQSIMKHRSRCTKAVPDVSPWLLCSDAAASRTPHDMQCRCVLHSNEMPQHASVILAMCKGHSWHKSGHNEGLRCCFWIQRLYLQRSPTYLYVLLLNEATQGVPVMACESHVSPSSTTLRPCSPCEGASWKTYPQQGKRCCNCAAVTVIPPSHAAVHARPGTTGML